MRLMLQDIKYQAKFDDLMAKSEPARPQEAEDDLWMNEAPRWSENCIYIFKFVLSYIVGQVISKIMESKQLKE